MKFSSIANISSGVYSNTINDGEVYYIQARDFDENRQLATNLSPVLSASHNFEKHYLRKGDILIVAKGAGFLSAVYDGTYQNAVASTVFLIARVKNDNQANPAYISWFINLPITQQLLLSAARGSSTPSINKKTLLDFEIPLPSIQKQQLVMELDILRKKEIEIKQNIDQLQENRFIKLILNSIKN